ncbi:MAG: hypothetical protein MH321_08905 [Leptospiraceae bacterium]|nr:hypothetical protein [Leptospiraceae bacterium]
MIINKIRILFDTNVFNEILDNKIPLPDSDKYICYATPLQLMEIIRTQDVSRKNNLLSVYNEIAPKIYELKSMVWGINEWESITWDENGRYYSILKEKLDQERKKN